MKKASNVKLSLRKLFIAMLAAAPVAILPSPVLAVIPTNLTTNTATNAETVGVGTIIQVAGSGSLSGSTGVFANISVSDKSVLVWSKGSFNIAGGETYHFAVPGGSVLNKVGYMANGTLQSSTDNVNIAGSLTSSGRVFILANGDITVTSAGGANVINTAGGLYLSTIQESNDFNFTSLGTLTSNGTNRGTITLGTSAPLTVTGGSLEAVSGNSIVAAGATLTSGDLILRTVGSGNSITLGSGNAITVSNGNLVVTTNNGIINQTNSITVAGTGKSASLTSGTANITLSNVTNDFGTVNISANNSNVTVSDANSITLGTVGVGTTGTLVVTSTAGSIDNAQPLTGGNVTLNAAAGNVTLTGANTPSAFGATAGAVSANFASAATINGVTATGGNVTLTSTGALTLAGNIGATSSTNVTLTGTSITSTGGAINGSTGMTNVSLNATGGGVTLGNLTARSINVKANNGSIGQLSGTNLTTADLVAQTFDAGTTGSITLTNPDNIFGSDAMLNLVGSTVSVTNNNAARLIISSANTTGALTINSNRAITSANTTSVRLGSGSGTNSGQISVGGALTINTYGVVTLNSTNSVTGFMGGIDDDDDLTIRVFGPVNLNTTAGSSTGGIVTFDSAVGSAGRGSASFGQISATMGNATLVVHENQSISLGTISAGSVTANSIAGNILIGGSFTASGNVSLNASTGGISQTSAVTLTSTNANSFFQSSNSSATILDNPSNSFGAVTGNIRIINGGNNVVNAASGFRLGNGTTNNLTLTATGTANVVIVQNNTTTGISGNNIVINSASPIEVQTTGNVRNLTLNTTNTSATSIFSAGGGNTTVNGTLTLTSLGGVMLNGTADLGAGTGLGTNITGSVVLSNVVGNVTLVNQRNLTLSGSSVQSNVTAVAGWGPSANTWNLNLGNLNVRSLTANVVNGEFSSGANPVFAGQSGNITQLANTSVHVENDANFITFNGGNIVVANNGNSFGRVSAYTVGSVSTSHSVGGNFVANGNVTIVEDGTLKVGNMITGGTASLTSRFGSVIEDTTTALTLNVATLSANSVNGSILLGGTTNGDTTTGTINAFNVNAPSGAVAIKSLGNVTIGATAANSLSVRSGNNIAQSGALNIFGTSVFNATNSIALNDSANNFGPVTMITANANAALSITEANTLNLRQVTIAAAGAGNGTFTATSINGSIIDTGLGGVKPAGIQNSTVTAIGTGSVSLNAINGDIIIDDPSSDFPTTGGVAFNAKNVTLSVLGNSTLTLGVNGTTSVATGNLLVKTALGSISNPGALNVTGTAAFETGAGNIVLNNAGNQFGSIRFSGNQVNIVEANDTVLLTGSSAIGAVVVQSGGNLTVSNAQPASSISFGSTVALQAAGTIIIPKLIQAAGTVSVNAPGLKDLGALSVSADLSGINPIFLPVGTTNYVAPQP